MKGVGVDPLGIMTAKEASKILNQVGRFLNRLLGIPIAAQNELFQYFIHLHEAHVKQAKRDGRYDDGIRTIQGQSVVVSAGSPLQIDRDGVKPGDVVSHQVGFA
ncbi:unnamed protein product [Phaeothamnion confervicola]